MFKTIYVTLALLMCAPAAVSGVRAIPRAEPSPAFDPAQSAALFVGVREFTHDESLTEVRYAVDDAVDLAFVLAMEAATRLVDPHRVILSLSGNPQKRQSQQNLDALLAAGAVVRPATQADILTLLERQSRTAGHNGLLIVAFATHGVSDEGTQYLLGASSLLQHRETAVSDAKVRDIASRSNASRSLILVDACRQRLTSAARGGDPDPRSAAPILRAMTGVSGQVVFSAAAAGEYAYDDHSRRNGVFTSAVIDGLRCAARATPEGLITVETLSIYVEDRVLTWIRKNRDALARTATQLNCEGHARAMPLSTCEKRQ